MTDKTKIRDVQTARSSEAGTTAIGMMFSTVIFAALIAGAMGLITTGRNMVSTGAERSDLEERAGIVSARIARELLGGRITVDPGGGNSLTFRKNRQGIDAVTGEVDWEAEGPIVYAFALVPGEAENGLDDNGDGLVDEGQIVRIENDVATVVSTGVRDGGLSFTRTGERVRIDLTLTGRDGQGQFVDVGTSRFVYPRN